MIGNHNGKCRFFVVKGHGAAVVITHEDGHEETWVGFATKDQAEAWVARKEAWVAKKIAKMRRNGAGKPAPG